MKSGFVELIVKNRLVNKPISKTSSTPRYQPVDSFRRFINSTLPKMQESIEIQLLKKTLSKIESPEVRKELVNSYLRRLFRIRQYEKDEIASYKQLQQIEQEDVISMPDPTIFKDISDHTEYDIGSYIVFSNEDFAKVFKSGSFGRFSEGQYAITKKFGIQIRKDGLGIVNWLKLLQQQHSNPKTTTYWKQLSEMNPEEKLQYINHEQIYPLLFNDLSNHVYQLVKDLKHEETYSRVWRNSVTTDVICHTALQNMQYIEGDVKKFVQKLVQEVREMKVAPSSGDFAKRFRQLPSAEAIQTKINGKKNPDFYANSVVKTTPPKFAQFYFNTPSFKNVFLGGEGGSGKSMIMSYVAMWAFKNNWILINVPSAYKWTNDRKANFERAFNGLHLIQEHAIEWLDQFWNCNQHLLGADSFQVDLSLYGKCDITGVHENEYEPVPNLWDERRKVHFDEIDTVFQYRKDVESKLKDEKEASLRMTDVCPTPKSLSEIIEAGISNPTYATCAVAEVLIQLQNSEKPLLQMVDGFSHFYRPSWYRSFKYFNDRGLYGYIPPYHIALCRLFMHLDGNKLKNGFKIVASSNYPLHNHKFDIKQLMFPQNYQHKVAAMTPQEFDKAGIYNILSKYWPADENLRVNRMYAYSISQGNWGDFETTIRSGHYY